MKHFEEELEEARETFPRVVEEFERIRLWVFTCLGHHVAMEGGPTVEATAEEHNEAAARMNAQKV